MKAGWFLIALGTVLAVGLRHSDAVVAGVGLVLLGAWMLSIKEDLR